MAREIKRTIDGLAPEQLPKHVAIIMDGNGRWAKKMHMPRTVGHRAGMERVKKIVKTSSDLGISVLTLYAFSTENWKRPKDEVSVIMSLLVEYLRAVLQDLLDNGVRFVCIGDKSRLPTDVMAILSEAEEATKNDDGMVLCVAVNYGSRAEIVNAAAKAAEQLAAGKIDKIDETAFSACLETAGLCDPDLVIRTSGEQRISNFLLYQIAYAEFYFADVHWPDFDDGEFAKALHAYAERNRRFGAV